MNSLDRGRRSEGNKRQPTENPLDGKTTTGKREIGCPMLNRKKEDVTTNKRGAFQGGRDNGET